ncbi:hypothetical protein AB0J20_18240 [Micromonospora costi]|uniref:hypothetical protein n=1 Tax=Micromonospora costi TaxID=1530042 RepID=UPI00340991D2
MSPKKPKARAGVIAKSAGERQPKAILRLPGNDGRLVVSFQHVDRAFDGAWGWPAAGTHDAWEVLDFLCEISRLTWGEILSQETGQMNKRHKKHHAYSTETVGSAARARLADLRINELTDELFRFRISGPKRLWGWRAEDVFHVLWWDPDHKVCPSDKN